MAKMRQRSTKVSPTQRSRSELRVVKVIGSSWRLSTTVTANHRGDGTRFSYDWATLSPCTLGLGFGPQSSGCAPADAGAESNATTMAAGRFMAGSPLGTGMRPVSPIEWKNVILYGEIKIDPAKLTMRDP